MGTSTTLGGVVGTVVVGDGGSVILDMDMPPFPFFIIMFSFLLLFLSSMPIFIPIIILPPPPPNVGTAVILGTNDILGLTVGTSFDIFDIIIPSFPLLLVGKYDSMYVGSELTLGLGVVFPILSSLLDIIIIIIPPFPLLLVG